MWDRPTSPSCFFPDFFTVWKEWRDIAGNFRIEIEPNNQELRLYNIKDSRVGRTALLSARCIDVMDAIIPVTDNSATWTSQEILEIVTYTTNDSCVSKYQCMRVRRRGPSVVEITLGKPMSAFDRACKEWNFSNVHKYVMIPAEMSVSPCPFSGSYSYVDKMSDCRGEIEIGCNDPSLITMKASCPSGRQTVEILQCNQNWTERMQTQSKYMIVSKPGDTQKISDCLVYKESIDGHELVAEEDCGGGNLRIMNKPIGVIIQPTRKACTALLSAKQPETSAGNHNGLDTKSHDMREGRDNRGQYREGENNINKTPQIDRKDITIISGASRTYSIHVIVNLVAVTLIASLR